MYHIYKKDGNLNPCNLANYLKLNNGPSDLIISILFYLVGCIFLRLVLSLI